MDVKIGYLKRFTLFQRDVRLYLISSAIMMLAIGIWGLLYNLLLVRLGYGPGFVGLVAAVSSFVYAGICLLSGGLGKWLGSRRIITVGFCACTLAFLIAGTWQLVPETLRAGWMMSASLCGWTGFAMFNTTGIPFLMRATSEEQRNYAFSTQAGLRFLAESFGGVVGGLLPGAVGGLFGQSLALPGPYSASLLAAGALSAPAVVFMLRTDKVGVWDDGNAKPKASGVPLAVISAITLFGLLLLAGQHVAFTFFNVYLDTDLGVSTAQIGILLAFARLVAIPASLAFPLIAKRIGERHTVTVAAVGVTLSLLPMALVPHWAAAALGLAGVIALGTIAGTAVTVYSQQLVRHDWQSVMSGALTMGMGVGMTGGTLAGGYAISAFGYRPLFAAGACVVAVATGLFWSYFRVPRGELARQLVAPAPVAVGAKPAE